MKVLRTNNPIVYNAERPNLPAYIYLRISGSQTVFLTGEHFISSQYYIVDNGKSYLLKAQEHVFSATEWENLRSQLLVGLNAAFDNLSNAGHQQALYIIALELIDVEQIYGTVSQDWSFFDVTPELESIHNSPTLF